jgi:hypothetical protein
MSEKTRWDAYYETHKESVLANKAAAYAANPELYKARVADYQARTGYTRKYYEENRETILAQKRERRLLRAAAKAA